MSRIGSFPRFPSGQSRFIMNRLVSLRLQMRIPCGHPNIWLRHELGGA